MGSHPSNKFDVNALGRRLAGYSAGPEFSYSFKVVNSVETSSLRPLCTLR